MKKIIKRLSLFAFTAVLTICFGCMVAFAQSNCDMQISPKVAGVGERINVTIEFSSGNMDIDSASAVLTYDSEIIEIAEDSPLVGSGGLVDLKGTAGDAPVVKFDVVFIAKKQGSTAIEVTGSNTFTADGSYLGSPSDSDTINVGTESGLDADSKLQALEVSEGQLTPAFSPDITSYTVNVDNNVLAVEISAQMNSVKSYIDLSGGFSDITGVEGTSPKIYIGKVNLNEGDNVKKIKITAENGEETVYTINVIRHAEGEIIPIVTDPPTATDAPTEDPLENMNIFQTSTSASSTSTPNAKNPQDDSLFEKLFPVIIVTAIVIAILLIAIVVVARIKVYKDKKKQQRRNKRKTQSVQRGNEISQQTQRKAPEQPKTVKATVKKKRPTNTDFKRPK